MKRSVISPIREVIYPNAGGYTGFSIHVWETANAIPESYYLRTQWGGVEGTDELTASPYVLEGRFFVFGSLPGRFLLNLDSLEVAYKVFDNLFSSWKPLMDEITGREKKLWDEVGRQRMHVDEILDQDLRNLIQYPSLFST